MRTFWTLTAVQLLICLVLATVDFGFDRPGQFGLDFEDVLRLLLLQAGLCLAGIVIAIRRKRWRLLLAVLFTMALTLAAYARPR